MIKIKYIQVGAPLLGLGLGLHGIGHGIRHAVSPFGLLNPLRPIGGIHSFRAGNIGPFKYAHSLLGAGNPMENEESMNYKNISLIKVYKI